MTIHTLIKKKKRKKKKERQSYKAIPGYTGCQVDEAIILICPKASVYDQGWLVT